MQRLDNPVRDYAWGSASDIPEFLGIAAGGGPVAELWIGAHPDSPSHLVRDGKSESLADLIAARPEAELGPEVVSEFGPRLPFLLKVLSAARPLSLQVHPDKQQAKAGYAAQQRTPGAPRDYTDDNHKPELICALRDGFQGLCGFRPVPQTRELLAALDVPGLANISDHLGSPDQADGLRNVVTSVLTSGTDFAPLIAAVRQACERLASAGGTWGPACSAYATVAAAYPADPGVLVALLLNYFDLAAGEAVFVGAGVPHCYLRGFGAELMASSDNVLRAGLTSKRVNVPELLRVLNFQPAELPVLRPAPAVATGSGPAEPGAVYPTPVDDFQLSRLDLSDQPIALPSGRPQILLCIVGAAQLRDSSGHLLDLTRGQSAYLSASDTGVTIAGHGTVLRATVGTCT
ncbi:MAG TPA: mannose-6-phosphate isomerase, class I [Streptosporangiaceae bacterium]|nr:mannose-6-phosphate isomerase, class I [Streptosporangiaceae bacterium]